MNDKNIFLLIVLCLISLSSCAQDCASEKKEPIKVEPHKYGGWYCPDNLNGFPAVDIAQWKKVPVVNGRMATREETQNGTSLIFVDSEKYPNAKPLDMIMPKLANFYNRNTGREELIIVIQAINIQNDSIVGFRYVNGGNGSAWLHEVQFLADEEIDKLHKTKFVSHDIEIEATQDEVWEVMTNIENAATFQKIFKGNKKIENDWRKKTNINYFYPKAAIPTSAYAGKLYGCFYVQNDFNFLKYTEKFLLLEDNDTKRTTMKISCGPYEGDYERQKEILYHWAQKVKEMSEKK